ncbi:MAG: F0F1 ATP synthase subunit A [Abditibacteriales bacterium]|nr:F0F1 ATP synthase subunit A [Abditibacteriales bacterium]MDW8364772.1 F0F1 ATP synthase subunit A [Abditibacteriales bacterium]
MAEHAAHHGRSVFIGGSGTWLEIVSRPLGLCYKDKHGAWVHNDWLVVAFAVMIGIAVVGVVGSRRRDLVPRGLQNGVEWVIEIFRGFCRRIIGEGGERYAPVVGTFFAIIFCFNLMGLVPGMISPTANTNATLALALCAFVITLYIGIRENGILGFIDHLAGSPSRQPWFMWWLPILMLPIELISLLARPVSLCFRLLGNIFGEDMVIHKLAQMAVNAFHAIYVPIPFQLPLMIFGMFTSFVQALVFSTLVAIYIALSLPHHDHEHAHGHEHALEHAPAHS